MALNISRRSSIVFISAFGLSAIGLPKIINATPEIVQKRINEITNGNFSKEADIFLDVPEIAENGNQVKVAFSIDSPMTTNDYVKEVYLLADGNPAPNVAKFSFTPFLGECSASTRMRLSKTQDVYLIAKFNNDQFALTQSTVKVTIGGCGG